MRETVSTTPRELVCFAPKPITATLTGTRRIVWNVLHNARGIFATRGMTTGEICRSIEQIRATYAKFARLPSFDRPRMMRRIRRAIYHLQALDLAERVGASGVSDQQPYRWRKTR